MAKRKRINSLLRSGSLMKRRRVMIFLLTKGIPIVETQSPKTFFISPITPPLNEDYLPKLRYVLIWKCSVSIASDSEEVSIDFCICLNHFLYRCEVLIGTFHLVDSHELCFTDNQINDYDVFPEWRILLDKLPEEPVTLDSFYDEVIASLY